MLLLLIVVSCKSYQSLPWLQSV